MFRGPAFQLPSGAVVVEDMWLASLNTTIDEILDSGLDGLKVFAEQTNPRGWVLGWLGHKVKLEGTDEQKQWYKALIDTFDQPGQAPIVPGPQPVPGLVRGLPADLMDFQHQPLQEVEVYRGLDDLVPEDVVHSGALPPDDDQDADVPEDGDAEDAA